MQSIGRALHVSPNKTIIIKAEKIPKIGDRVVDESLKPVGTVFDIFGPVSSPYVVVKPHVGKMSHLIKNVLYVDPSSKVKMRKRPIPITARA